MSPASAAITEPPKSIEASGAPATPPATIVGSDLSERAEKLRLLKKLKDEGILTEEEYEKKRKLIVEGM
jgi:hypothetical protein